MITISVSASPEGPFALVGAGELSFSFGSPTRFHSYYGLLLSSHGPPALSDSVEIGPFGYLDQSPFAYGRLRDKGVRHLNVKGDLSVSSNTLQVSVGEDGFPIAQTTLGTLVPHCGVVAWNDPFEFTFTWIPVPNNHPQTGEIISQPEGVVVTRKIRFFDNRCIVIHQIERHPMFKAGVLYRPFEVSSVVEKLRRESIGGPIRDMGLTVVYDYLDEDDMLNLLESIPVSGGATLTMSEYVQGESSDLETLVEDLSAAVQDEIRSLNLFYYTDSYLDFGLLALDCSKQMRFVDNDLLNAVFDVAEFTSLLETWKAIVDSDLWGRLHALAVKLFERRASFRTFRRASKDLVDLFLSTKYGVFPSISDTESLVQAVRAFSSIPLYRRLHSRKETSADYPGAISASHSAVLTVEVGMFPNDSWGYAMEIIAGFKRFGAWPETHHLLDRLIYSFIADWFVQFGSMFQDIDNYLNVKNYFPVDRCILSETWEMVKLATDLVPQHAVTGTVSFRYYVRWITREVPLPPVALTAESSVGIHSLEALALVLQRVR